MTPVINAFNPFLTWSRFVAAGQDLSTTWIRSVETLQASETVIRSRTDKMQNAVRDPYQADVIELARMIPEKVEAFGQSTAAVGSTLMQMYAAWMTQSQRVASAFMRGRLLSPSEFATLANQTNEYLLGAMAATAHLGTEAISPIHRTALRNARRLGGST